MRKADVYEKAKKTERQKEPEEWSEYMVRGKHRACCLLFHWAVLGTAQRKRVKTRPKKREERMYTCGRPAEQRWPFPPRGHNRVPNATSTKTLSAFPTFY